MNAMCNVRDAAVATMAATSPPLPELSPSRCPSFEVLGAADGMTEDKASWVNFFQWLRSRGLDGVKLIVGD